MKYLIKGIMHIKYITQTNVSKDKEHCSCQDMWFFLLANIKRK